MMAAAPTPTDQVQETNNSSTNIRPQRQQRRQRGPVIDTLGGINKFLSLFHGSRICDTVLQKAFEAVFATETVTIAYSPSHEVEQVLDFKTLLERFQKWNETGVQVDLKEIKPLAPTIMQYSLSIVQPLADCDTSYLLEEDEDEPEEEEDMSVSVTSSVVCTATLREGKIISCIEKTVEQEQELPPSRRMDRGLSMKSIESVLSSSSSHRGTGLEHVELRGGAIFLNKNLDTTLVTVVVEQDGGHTDLELVDFNLPGAQGVEKPETACNGSSEPFLLLRDMEHEAIVLCRACSEEKGIYFIDGRVPLFPNDEAVACQGGVSFYPRYKYDLYTVEIWTGSSYETYMDMSDDEPRRRSPQSLTRAMMGFGKQDNQTTNNNNNTPSTSANSNGGDIPECIAHVSRKGRTNLMRAKIKIPAGGDPSLMICLTSISDHHRRVKKFTKLHVRKNADAPPLLVPPQPLSLSPLTDLRKRQQPQPPSQQQEQQQEEETRTPPQSPAEESKKTGGLRDFVDKTTTSQAAAAAATKKSPKKSPKPSKGKKKSKGKTTRTSKSSHSVQAANGEEAEADDLLMAQSFH